MAYGQARDKVAEIKERSAGQLSLLASLQAQEVAIMADLEHLEIEDNDAVETLSRARPSSRRKWNPSGAGWRRSRLNQR